MSLEGKDLAYWERNQLVLYLSKMMDAWIEQHPIEDKTWENDWRNIIFIDFPQGLFSWHIHDSEIVYFKHLEKREGNSWKGESLIQKYDSLREKPFEYKFIKNLVGNLTLGKVREQNEDIVKRLDILEDQMALIIKLLGK